MIILSTLSLLISNAVSLRRDMAILYNRIAIIALLYAILQSLISFSIISNGGIGIHGGLFHVTNITQVFHIFLYFISILILQLTSFYPAIQSRKLEIMWVGLSNSGDALKLMVPNYSWKTISGWTNHSCKVISHNMIEREMGNRGSKSVLLVNSTVKEQRVNGSRSGINLSFLRCTLKGFERNYQAGILSNHINTYRYFSSLATQPDIHNRPKNFYLNPWFISGFTDAVSQKGSGCFTIFINRNSKHLIGWEVKVSYQINIHKKDLSLLRRELEIQSYFGVGSISKQSEFTYQYRVQSIKDMVTIINHFDNYPLRAGSWKTNWLSTYKKSF